MLFTHGIFVVCVLFCATSGGAEAAEQVFVITVVNEGGSVFAIDGVPKPVLTLERGGVYTFMQSAPSNAYHQLAFKDGFGLTYSTGVVTTGEVGTPGAQTVITVAADAPDNLRYYCVAHGDNMGNIISIISQTQEPTTSTPEPPDDDAFYLFLQKQNLALEPYTLPRVLPHYILGY